MIARELALQLEAVYLRIDSIEEAIRASGVTSEALVNAGYRVGYAVAEDNLLLGRTAIADSVNPLALTRDAWLLVGNRARVKTIKIEVKCSDAEEYRRHMETRGADISGLRLPTWKEVVSRDYDRWGREHIVIDTAGPSIEQNVEMIRGLLREQSLRDVK